MGHIVHVVTRPAPNFSATTKIDGYLVHRPRLSRAGPLFTIQLRRWLKTFIRSERPDLVHVHGIRPLEATKDQGVPVIFTNHTSGFLRRVEQGANSRTRIAKRMSHLDQVLAPSEELCAATERVGYRGPIDFIPNGVDTDRFKPSPPARARTALHLPLDRTIVLLARRLVPKNGCRYFAESTAAFSRSDVHILVAGDGSERTKIKEALKATNFLDRTTFLGAVDNDHMPIVYNAADISVLPSLQEATSITGLESMASGLPLVGTRVGGIPTLIEHGASGLLVAARHPAALGEAIDSLVRSPTQRTTMGIRARALAEQKFSWPRIADRTAAVYESVRKYKPST